MQPKHPILIGTALSASLLPALGSIPSAGFLIGTIVIDADHYLDFLVHNRFRDFSVRKMFRYHQRLFLSIKRPEFISLEIFHTFECLACLTGLSLHYPAPSFFTP